MGPRSVQRWVGVMVVVAGVALPLPGHRDDARAGSRRVDPAQVLPLDQVAAGAREGVAEVMRDAHFHRAGKSDTFPSNPRLYMKLLNEPVLTLALWQDLAATPARLQQVGPDRFTGGDGAGAVATWDYVLRSPRLHVMLCNLDYTSPRGNARLQGRIVLIVRSNFFQHKNGEFWVQHEVEAFVKIDSRGWKAAAVTFRPLIERLLEDQVQEAGWFVSLMARLVETYPDWATGVVSQQQALDLAVRAGFVDLVKQIRRPGAATGRPQMADNTDTRKR